MPHVMLRKDWPGVFHRTVYKQKGKQLVAVKRLEFKPGEAVELSPSELPAVAGDIGKALLPVTLDEKARPRVVQLDESDVEDLAAAAAAPAGDEA